MTQETYLDPCMVLLTWYGEVLRFTDAVPSAGDPLRTWLRDQAVL